LIIKFIFGIIFFNKKNGLNIFLLDDDEVKYYNLNEYKDHENRDHENQFSIYIGKEKIR
jgi:hypothetical protein